MLADAKGKTPEIILIATGSEVAPALEAREVDGGRHCRAPGEHALLGPFREAAAVLSGRGAAAGVTARLAVEAGGPFGWERYVGPQGAVHGIDRFGASAPWKVIAEKLGFTGRANRPAGARTFGTLNSVQGASPA